MTDDSFRSRLGEAAKTISEVGPIDPAKWNEFASNLYYSHGDYKDPESYAQLAKRLASRTRKRIWAGTGYLLFDASGGLPGHRRAVRELDWRAHPNPELVGANYY